MSAHTQRYIADLTGDEISELEKRMRPQKYSQVGFLGADESLRAVIERDSAYLHERGITHDQIADKLEHLIGRYERLNTLALRAAIARNEPYERVTTIPGEGELRAQSYFGSQNCPWEPETSMRGGACPRTDMDWRYENIHGDELAFSGLMPHLIRDHHFFEGETSYRVDPAHAIEVLGIEPGVDYAPNYVEETIWEQVQASTIGIERKEDLDRFRWPDFLTTVRTPAGNVRISIIGDTGVMTSETRSITSIIDRPMAVPAEMVGKTKDRFRIDRPLTLPGGTLYPLSKTEAIIPIKLVIDRHVAE